MASISDQLKEFSQTPAGKAAVVVVPVLILAVILAVIFLTLLRGGPETEPTAATQDSSATPAATETAPPVEAEEPGAAEPDTATETVINENFEVYETRDPFKPMNSTQTVSGTAGTGGNAQTGGTSGTTASQSQVLSLQGVSEQGGTLYANVKYNGVSYTLKAGDRVGDSAYQLRSVTDDSATFLYGDDQLTLRVGEEVTK